LVALVRVFDRLKDAMAVYGGSGRKRKKRKWCKIESGRVRPSGITGVVCTRPVLAA